MSDETYVFNCDASQLVGKLRPESVDLFLFDPPYYDIVGQKWDKQWKSVDDYVRWFEQLTMLCIPALKPHGSFIFFGAIGSENFRPFWSVCTALDAMDGIHYRNVITWKKRRGYGKSHDYLFCREEIAWYSRSAVRTEVTFNIPYTSEKRGYSGFNKKYPAKSDYKRVSNVWDDIPELMRPSRQTQKPVPLMERLVLTHSNVDDLIVDPFCGTGTTGEAALRNGRRFIGCDTDEKVAITAEERCQIVTSSSSVTP